MRKLVGEVRKMMSAQRQLVVTLLKPWKLMFGSGKKKKRKRRSSCTTKLPTRR